MERAPVLQGERDYEQYVTATAGNSNLPNQRPTKGNFEKGLVDVNSEDSEETRLRSEDELILIRPSLDNPSMRSIQTNALSVENLDI